MRPLALAALAATLAVCAVAAAPAAAQEPTTLVVVETASVRAAPDTATVAATIRRRAGRAAVARRRVERRVAEVLRALDALGVPRADVRTSSVRSFATRPRRGAPLQHVATTSLRVRTARLDLVGRIVAAFGGAHVEGPEFGVADSTAARQEATRIALARARARADAAAAELGMRVLGIRLVDLNPEFGFDASEVERASGGGGGQDDAGSAPVTIEPGEDEVVVAVAVVYDVGP